MTPSPRRRFPLSVLLAALLVGTPLVATSLYAAPAWAQSAPVFEGQGVIELVAPTGLVGDGMSVADLYILALGPDGRPYAGLKGKPITSAGIVSDVTDMGNGLYRFTWTPPKLDQRSSVSFTWKTRLPNKEPVARNWVVSVAPHAAHAVTVGVNPQTLTLNQDKSASLTVTLSGGDRTALASVELKTNVTSGGVDNITNLGNGQFSALYQVPTVGFPHVALVTLADKRDPAHTYGSAAIPLVGRADFPVRAAPNSRVLIKVAGRDFGPIPTDAQGNAKVPIIVPPGASNSTLVQIAADGKITESPLDLKIPDSKRIALFPTSQSVPSDARQQVPVRLLVVTPDGKPDGNAQVAFTSTAGTIGPATHEGGGVYVAMFTPPTGNANTSATITARLANGSSLQTDTVAVNLIPTRPTKVALSAEPAVLPPGADGFKVFAKVTGPDQAGLGSRTISFSANGARLKEMKDLRNGDYQASFSTTGSGPVEVGAVVSTASTGNPLARVLLIPSSERVLADGLSSTLITVATVDEYGYPVPSVNVNLRLVNGDGALPASTSTGPDGLAQIYYTSGRKNTVVTAEASSGDLAAATTLLQIPPALAVPDLPVSGPKAAAGLVEEWANSLGTLRIERDGATGMVVPASVPGVTVTPGVPGRPSKLGLTSDPATVAAGGSVTLRIQLTDDQGRGVGGQQLDFLTSAGTVGPVSELGGGAYLATLMVPVGTGSEIKVSAATRDGTVSTFVRVPVGGSATAWGTGQVVPTTPTAVAVTPTPTTPTAPVTPVTAPTPTTVAPMGTTTDTATTTVTRVEPEGDRRWLRLRAGYTLSGYNYHQLPLDSSGAIFPTELEVPTIAQGFSLQARTWIPGVKYVGAQAGFRLTSYAIDPSPLCDELGRPCQDSAAVADSVKDFHILGIGRYPFAVGSSNFWLGGRVGGSVTDIQAIQATETAINLPQISIGALALGVEAGAEFGPGFFLQAAFTEYLAGGSSPYVANVAAELGYDVTDNLFVSVAFDHASRQVDVLSESNKKLGEIDDQTNAGTLSLGFAI